jgi:hypothetical protein
MKPELLRKANGGASVKTAPAVAMLG